jgi:hypothetical protein
VSKLKEGEYQALTPEQKSNAPEEIGRAKYWPNGPGAKQLRGYKSRRALSNLGVASARSSSIQVIDAAAVFSSPNAHSGELVKRADDKDRQILELGDEGYPSYYSIDDMVKWYGDIKW